MKDSKKRKNHVGNNEKNMPCVERPLSKMPACSPFSSEYVLRALVSSLAPTRLKPRHLLCEADSADFISSNQNYLICIRIHISGPYVSPV